MGSWISYTFVAGLVLLALYLVYDWLMAAENQPRFNRVVLLSCYAVAAVFPLVDFESGSAVANMAGTVDVALPVMTGVADDAESAVPVWPYIIICVYLAGVLGVAVMTVRAFVVLSRLVGGAEKVACGRYTLAVVDDGSIAPFSWRRYIVMNRDDYRENRDLIITHETAHLDRRHRYDLLLARVFEVAVWYNPAVWLMTQSLRSVHEYEADRAVVARVESAHDYQMLLIKKAVGRSFPVLANSLNHSNLKKRITMMLKPKSRKSRRVRALALVPAVAVALLSVNIPFVANALDSMSATSIGLDSGNKDSKKSDNEQPKETVFTEVEQMPQFPGGDGAMMKFIKDNLKYPESESGSAKKCMVIVKFVVGKDGAVRDAEIMRSQGEAFDAEALRVVNLMPKFVPGRLNGEPVAVSFTLPVMFK